MCASNTRLNEVPLRLEWLQLEMAMALHAANRRRRDAIAKR